MCFQLCIILTDDPVEGFVVELSLSKNHIIITVTASYDHLGQIISLYITINLIYMRNIMYFVATRNSTKEEM